MDAAEIDAEIARIERKISRMARTPHDREDLFAEAKGIVPKAEWRHGDQTVLVGQKRAAGLVVYLSPDEMIGFTTASAVRRLFDHGVIYRAAAGRQLEQLSPGPAGLQTSAADSATVAALLGRYHQRLSDFVSTCRSGDATLGRVDGTTESSHALLDELERILQRPLVIADGM